MSDRYLILPPISPSHPSVHLHLNPLTHVSSACPPQPSSFHLRPIICSHTWHLQVPHMFYYHCFTPVEGNQGCNHLHRVLDQSSRLPALAHNRGRSTRKDGGNPKGSGAVGGTQILPVTDHGELVVGSVNIEKMVDAGKSGSTLTVALLKLSVLADLGLRVENIDSEINTLFDLATSSDRYSSPICPKW